jgi:hypothetical protein
MSGFDPASISLGSKGQVALADPNARMIVAQANVTKQQPDLSGLPQVHCINTTDCRGSNNRGCTNVNEC